MLRLSLANHGKHEVFRRIINGYRTQTLAHTATVVGNQPYTWFESFKRQGFYFRYAALITIITGLYVHITRLFLGDDLLVQHVVTAAV